MARTIEFEKTSSGQVRYKWSNRPFSNFILNALNVRIGSSSNLAGDTGIQITFAGAPTSDLSFNLSDITTINGAPAPATVEETLALLTDQVFSG